ncbi:hypothetical protein [Mycoplasma feriruminatoris]|uniref:hypothetical protein n=1 Tax=Mycoplasma feriruminatoris TaxID=1179777 RepID=UPI00241EF4B6|nr:hypothetical protein [Mycoplasma feriruminatoris]WFQ94401.1 hypothetical protein MFERI15220_00479 [Mycoplasma feriruminatoris]
MKKFLTILGFLTVLSSSLVVVACKTPGTEQKNNKDNEKLNNKNDKLDKKDNKTENINTLNDKDSPQADQPHTTPMVSEKEKEKKIDEVAKKLKAEIEDIVSKKEKEKIKNYAFGFVEQTLRKTFEQKGKERISKLDSEILDLFSKSNFDQIKVQINLLFSEIHSNNSNSSQNIRVKITDLLSGIEKKEKEEILEIANNFLIEILQNEFNLEKKKINDEIEKLLKDNSFDKLKEKLFSLLKQATELEKLSIK